MVAGAGISELARSVSYSQFKKNLLLRETAFNVYAERLPTFEDKEGVTGEPCIVTGAAQGIGLEIATQFARY